MFGLYDNDGILRFTGLDREACLAYADLFEIPRSGCSLMDLPDQEFDGVVTRRSRKYLGGSSN